MTYLRKSNERGHVQISWLDSRHTFSFGDYHAPEHSGFKSLRVINEDSVAGGGGFAPHPHKDMEIITYMVSGALQHKDSTGQEGVIRRGDVQMMSAGRGIVHSEFNASKEEKAHLLQIWVHPKERGLEPSYQQSNFAKQFELKDWVPLVSPEGEGHIENSLVIRQDLELWARTFEGGEKFKKDLGAASSIWVQLVSGEIEIEGQKLEAGDGLGLEVSDKFEIHAKSKGEILLFVFN